MPPINILLYLHSTIWTIRIRARMADNIINWDHLGNAEDRMTKVREGKGEGEVEGKDRGLSYARAVLIRRVCVCCTNGCQCMGSVCV